MSQVQIASCLLLDPKNKSTHEMHFNSNGEHATKVRREQNSMEGKMDGMHGHTQIIAKGEGVQIVGFGPFPGNGSHVAFKIESRRPAQGPILSL